MAESIKKMAEPALEEASKYLGSPDKEDSVTKMVEKQTAKIPSIGFLGLAIGAMALSAGLQLFSKKKDPGSFVGLWVPTFLLFGIYNKLVKQHGSDKFENSEKAA